MKTMVFRQIGRTFYVANGQRDISNDDFDACIKVIAVAASTKEPLTMLVHSDGGAPNSMQRSRFHKVVESGQLTVAVLTESSVARGVIMAFGWTGSIKVRGFAPSALDKAIQYLGWTETSTADAQMVLNTLRAQVAG